jgi:hypothetical protein
MYTVTIGDQSPYRSINLSPDEPIEQRPRQDKATQALQQPTSPELRAPAKEHL